MKKIFLFLSLGIVLSWNSCSDGPLPCLPVTTDSEANLNQFLGLWYEIASFPQFFNTGCSCTTAEYSLAPDGNSVIVSNSCTLLGFIPNNIQGNATQPDPNDFSKLEVSFPLIPGPPGDYWILEFASDGSYMLVGDPAKENLYILSRTHTLDPVIYEALVDKAELMCFDVDNLELTPQTCN